MFLRRRSLTSLANDKYMVCTVDPAGFPIPVAAEAPTTDKMPDKLKNRKPPSRRKPEFIVKLEGEDMADRHYTQFIESVYVEDTCDKIPIAKVIFNNSDGRFTNEPLWDANMKMIISVGYPEAGMVEKVGTFITRPARFIFGGKQQVIIEGWGEEVTMSFPEKRRVFNEMTDNDIVQSIADEYGFKADIMPTTDVYEQVIQANESDMNFLIRRARLYGYIVYVKHGVLHFHSPKYISSEIVLSYRDGDKSTLSGFSVGIVNDHRGRNYKASHIEPIKQEIFTVEGAEYVDSLTKTTAENFGDIDMWDKLMTVKNNEHSAYLVNEGNLHTQEHYQQIVDARSRQSRWIIKGTGKSLGLETINAGETIGLLGLKRWSGEYLLTKVVHDFTKQTAYSIYFDVTRTWTGISSEAELKSSQTSSGIGSSESQITEANSVEVAR